MFLHHKDGKCVQLCPFDWYSLVKLSDMRQLAQAKLLHHKQVDVYVYCQASWKHVCLTGQLKKHGKCGVTIVKGFKVA